jgi:hypothetical protein
VINDTDIEAGRLSGRSTADPEQIRKSGLSRALKNETTPRHGNRSRIRPTNF